MNDEVQRINASDVVAFVAVLAERDGETAP
jgi:hypothetical protein